MRCKERLIRHVLKPEIKGEKLPAVPAPRWQEGSRSWITYCGTCTIWRPTKFFAKATSPPKAAVPQKPSLSHQKLVSEFFLLTAPPPISSLLRRYAVHPIQDTATSTTSPSDFPSFIWPRILTFCAPVSPPCLRHSAILASIAIMAAAQQQVPTFKLVLVGDGGTGKVS